MVGVLVLSHGCLGEEILAAARMIAGELPGAAALCLHWDEDLASARERVAAAIAELDRGQGVLVLTDLHGGTPTRVAQALHRPGRVEIVTGVNLAMLVKLGCLLDRPEHPAGLADILVSKGRASIQILNPRHEESETR